MTYKGKTYKKSPFLFVNRELGNLSCANIKQRISIPVGLGSHITTGEINSQDKASFFFVIRDKRFLNDTI